MNKQTPISEMRKFHFGNTIICTDGEDGTLANIIVNAAERRITHIGVKQSRLFGKIAYFPFENVVEATGDGVTLNIKRADVAAATSTNIDGTLLGTLLNHKSIVENTDTEARGTLMLVAVYPGSGELAYLVAHHLPPGQDTLILQEYVSALLEEHVKVTIPFAIFDTLPPYRSDRVLQQEVEAVLYDIVPLHIDLKGITIRVLDSVLYLDGNISSSLRGDIAQDQVLGVPGLLEIKNRLIGDDTLAGDLAMALGRDPRTRDLPIGVYPRLGIVRLSGAVHTSQQKSAAGEIASTFPGVRSVINDLLIDPKADMLHVLSSSESGEAEDKVPGKYVRHTK